MLQMLRDDIRAELEQIPVIDVHSHLGRDQLVARNLSEIVLYHMVRYPLRAAGVSEGKLWPGRDFHALADEMDEQVFEKMSAMQNTSFAWALRQILRDLYDFDEPITAQSLEKLQAAFEERTSRDGWGRQVLREANIERILSSRYQVPPLADGQEDPGIRFTIETAPTAGWREYMTWADRLERIEQRTGRQVRSADELREMTRDYYDRLDWSDKHGLVAWISSDCDFRPANDREIDRILKDVGEKKKISPADRSLLEAALVRSMLDAVRGKTRVWQVVYGTHFLTPGRPHPVAKAPRTFVHTLGYLIGEYPDIHFDMLSGYEPDEPVLCSLTLGYSNVSLSSFWWNNFYPDVMHRALSRRLDMVPASRLCGFFSDGYCVDWIYGRLQMTRRVLANVLAEKVDQGFYSVDQAIGVARALLHDTPRELFDISD